MFAVGKHHGHGLSSLGHVNEPARVFGVLNNSSYRCGVGADYRYYAVFVYKIAESDINKPHKNRLLYILNLFSDFLDLGLYIDNLAGYLDIGSL